MGLQNEDRIYSIMDGGYMTESKRSRTYTWEDPMVGAGHAQTMSGMEYLQAMMDGKIPPPPIAQTLDFILTEMSEGRAVFTCTPSEFHYNPIGMVHGGLIATLLDSALGCCIHTLLPAGTAYTTLEIHTNLVRPLTRDTGEIRCEGNILHIGKRMATAEAKVTDRAGKLYGHGTTTCMIFPAGG
jgi:uncharacterized protein (TIGR00369 family)